MPEELFCLSTTNILTVICPENHHIRIINATLYRTPSGGCPQNHVTPTSCYVSTLTNKMQVTCQKKESCNYQIQSPSDSTCSGQLYALMVYNCNPGIY